MPIKIGILVLKIKLGKERIIMFCDKCGTELVDGICPKCVENERKNKVAFDTKIKNIFVSQTEKIVAVLGQDYLEEYIQKGMCSGGFAVVSDKRLYFLGVKYDIHKNVFGRKRPRKSKQSKAIDLKDIRDTGDSIYRQNRLFVISMVIIHTILAIIFLLLSPFITLVFIILMLFYLINHITTNYHMLTVQYNGGEIAFYRDDFPEEEIAFFQRQLRLAKDEVTANNDNIEKNMIKEAVSSVIQSTSQSSKADELVKLADLLSKGIISQEEFEKMKKELI